MQQYQQIFIHTICRRLIHGVCWQLGWSSWLAADCCQWLYCSAVSNCLHGSTMLPLTSWQPCCDPYYSLLYLQQSIGHVAMENALSREPHLNNCLLRVLLLFVGLVVSGVLIMKRDISTSTDAPDCNSERMQGLHCHMAHSMWSTSISLKGACCLYAAPHFVTSLSMTHLNVFRLL